ncbi:MFS transporter [Streptomyces sp. NPDC047049]|uniref:MFS transporter n=1 Tax=Streptomyces sp. NPDC047049 TaxID=3156688 RepID=UPI003401C658
MIAKLRAAVPSCGPARTLVLSGFSGSIGTGLFLAGSMLFFTRGVGLSPFQVSLGLSLAAVLGMIASVPVGSLADRVGPRRALIALHIWRVVAYSLYVTVHSFAAFLVVVCATTMADKASPSVNQAMVGTLFDQQERLRTMGFLRAVQNVGLSLGALIAAFALPWDSRSAYDTLALGNAASYVVMAFLIWRIRGIDSGRAASAKAAVSAKTTENYAVEAAQATAANPFKELPFLALSGLNGVLALHDTVLFVGLPLWIAQFTRAPVSLVSVALILNTLITALSQTWWTQLADTTAKAVRGMVIAGLVLALAALSVGPAAHVGTGTACVLLLCGVLLLTVGENLHAASAWAISFELSPATSRARYLSVFGLGQSTRDLVGPALITTVVIGMGTWGWIGLAALFTLAGAASRRAALSVERIRQMRSAQTATDPPTERMQPPAAPSPL